jgi:hypothetical protein
MRATATAVARVVLFFIWFVRVVVGFSGGDWRKIDHGGRRKNKRSQCTCKKEF